MQHQHILITNRKRAPLLLAALAVIVCLLSLILTHDVLASEGDQSIDLISANSIALPGFESTLPLIVMELPENTLPKEEEAYFLSGSMSIYNNDEGRQNTLEDKAEIRKDATVRNVTDKSNASGEKCDYYFRFDNEDGVLGFTPTAEYTLLGGGNDKSLLRNYVGYTLAQKMGGWQVESKLCELFVRTASGNRYQGVYLLVAHYSSGGDYLFHQSQEPEDISVDTFASTNDKEYGSMSLPFIKGDDISDEYYEAISGISGAESLLYATESRTFYQYSESFDVSTFRNALILGEVMENYHYIEDGYYYFNNETGLVRPATFWNFETSLDNDPNDPVIIDQVRYELNAYYKNLFKSPQFVSNSHQRYIELRRSVLDEGMLEGIVDEGAALVRSAVKRDWRRWNNYEHYSLEPLTEIVDLEGELIEKVNPFERQTKTYEQELVRMKYHLHNHNLYLSQAFADYSFSDREISREIALNTSPIGLIIFLVVLFYLIRFARKYGV